jgi:lysine/arginine/ornithine transport system substrate-binding protein
MSRLAAGLGLVLLVSSAPARAADLADIKARGALRVLVVATRGANEFFPVNPDPQPGFDREVLEGFASLQRVRLEVVPVVGWDTLIPDLQAGKGDVIAGRFTVTEARKKLIAFSSEVFPTRNVVLTRRPHRVVATLEQLREERVGTVRGTSLAEAVAAAGIAKANVDDTIPTGTLPDALKAGQVSAVVLGVENAISAQRTDPALQLGMFLGPPNSLAYGVRRQDAALLAALNGYIENLRRTPTWSRLVVKYFGEMAPEVLKKARTE